MKAAGLITAGAFQRGEAQTSRAASMPAEASDGWVSLFNGRNLDGWYTMLQQSAGPDKSGLTVVMYLFQNGYVSGDLGYASAVGWTLALGILTISLAQMRVTGAWKGTKD